MLHNCSRIVPLVTHSKDNHIGNFKIKMFLQLIQNNNIRILQEPNATCYKSTILYYIQLEN